MRRSDFASLPPLHALAAFEAVARLQSFSRAADELCITHGAVSHRIKLLEKHFGVELFVRSGRAVSLSAKGTNFLGAVLDALSTLQEASARLADTSQKTVRISVGPSFSRNWLIERLGGFFRKHPDINLEISATKLTKAEKLASLKSGKADVEVRYGIADDWSEFKAVKLLEGRLFPVCAPAYRKSLGGMAKPQDMAKAVLLRLPHEPWKPWFEAAGLDFPEPARGPLFSDASLMLDTAANGQGIALARSLIVDDYLLSRRLVKLWDISIASPHAYFAVLSASAAGRSEVRAFADWLVAAAATS